MFCLRPLSGRLIVSCEVKRRGSRKVGKGVSIWDMEYGNDETQNPGGIRGLVPLVFQGMYQWAMDLSPGKVWLEVH
ncbi:predicted protein [Sclerotinia sclerotiorum 1980 UF-70]|uniref:Uncharacterized protein n=1 Tax=Sclerotinia sclerotiorum (strain ATCC 18683 / 1980 / Ss-1) TaxID=665079 RepID=A7EF45_SCLS1|nr:predicted protein [Sclerotinia sclerotiorum 1980 UF-70]EDO01461.1 predicted protein [Sclerotinia sclerotiorum 1980 UF-70]